jgi:2-polyprenyl-3-methyl-5-hydroxy-6-metoxy-1,4-benzoquinol methylase
MAEDRECSISRPRQDLKHDSRFQKVEAQLSVMKNITLAELDHELEVLSGAEARSDDELRRGFGTFQLALDQSAFPDDPYSEEYYRSQMALYCRIAVSEGYQLSNERTLLDGVENMARVPFPYYTRSPQTVSDQLMAIGFIIRTLNLPAGATILEFGPGWGNTTIHLARMGYSVTAVDIEPNFVEIIKQRAAAIACPVRVMVGNFGSTPEPDERFDAILFFECFHHCADHLKLIDRLRELVNPGGVVAFAAEPILEEFHAPWGVRLDGMALWSIRRSKWMELGYKESYFVRTMMRAGWTISKHVCNATPLGVVFLARRNSGVYNMGELLIPKDEESTWAPPESDPAVGVRFTAGDSVLSLDQDVQWNEVSVDVVNSAPFPQTPIVRCGGEECSLQIMAGAEATFTLRLPATGRKLRISSSSWCPKELHINEDPRILGVAVRRLRFR